MRKLRREAKVSEEEEGKSSTSSAGVKVITIKEVGVIITITTIKTRDGAMTMDGVITTTITTDGAIAITTTVGETTTITMAGETKIITTVGAMKTITMDGVITKTIMVVVSGVTRSTVCSGSPKCKKDTKATLSPSSSMTSRISSKTKSSSSSPPPTSKN